MTSPEKEGELTPEEAFIGLALCAVYVDGVLAAEEFAELDDLLAEQPFLAALGESGVRQAHQKAERLARKLGERRLSEVCARRLPPAWRGPAYRIAAELLTSDSEVADSESEFLVRLEALLGIEAAERDAIRAELGLP